MPYPSSDLLIVTSSVYHKPFQAGNKTDRPQDPQSKAIFLILNTFAQAEGGNQRILRTRFSLQQESIRD